jgi:hypothetical protein
MSLYSNKEEYMAAANAAYEKIWLRRILADLQVTQVYSTTLHYDKQDVFKLAKNPIFHDHQTCGSALSFHPTVRGEQAN